MSLLTNIERVSSFSMLEMDLPLRVHAVGATLLTGDSIILPPLKENLLLFVDMLENVTDLSVKDRLVTSEFRFGSSK